MRGAATPWRSPATVASALVLAAIAGGASLLAAAMSRYPGGTALDPTSAGHSFWFNFLCDVTGDVAVNGRSNQVGAWLARAALLSFCVALTGFWMVLPASFGGRGRRLSFGIRAAGAISVAGLLAVPLAHGWGHVAAVFASSVPALVAGALALVGTVRFVRAPALAAIGCATLATSLMDSVLYAQSYLVQPRVVVPALPLLQRTALLLMLAWMAVVAIRQLRAAAPAPGPAAGG